MFLSSSHTLSMLLVMAAILYGHFGMFTVNDRNRKANQNYIIYIASSLSLWSFGLACSLGARSAAISVLWYQIGSLGFGLVFCFVLHYIFFMTDHRLLPHKLISHVLLYAPALIFGLTFSIPTFRTDAMYKMVPTDLGWVASGTSQYFKPFYYGYVFVFVFIYIAVLYGWSKKNNLKTTDPFSASLRGVSIVVGLVAVAVIFVDLILSTFTGDLLPDFGPLFAMIPSVIVLTKLDMSGMLDFYYTDNGMEILRSEAKDQLFKYIAYAFMAGGLIAFILEYAIGGNDFVVAMVFGLIIALYGYVLKYVLSSDYETYRKDNLISITVATFIPFLMFFTLIRGSGTTWPVPVLFMVAFMLYNNSRMIISVAIASLLSTVAIGVLSPYNEVTLDIVDHGLRLLLLVLFVLFSIAINRFYILKLLENQQRFTYQKLIGEITSHFARSTLDDFDREFDSALQIVCRCFEVDRIYYFDINTIKKKMVYTKGWRSRECEVMIGSIDTAITTFPWWMDRLENEGYIEIEDVLAMSDEAESEKNELIRQNVRSTLAVPLVSREGVIGFVGLSYQEKPHKWDPKIRKTLITCGNVLADAKARNKAEKQVYDMAYRDYLTSLPNRASFFESLKQCFAIANREDKKILVGLMDLDGFKGINDTFGHEAGDHLLVELSQRIRADIRSADMISRYGGDEFLMYFYDVDDKDSAKLLSGAVLDLLKEPINHEGHPLSVTGSMGLVLTDGKESKVEDVVSLADKAMYKAKKAGKNRTYLIDHSSAESREVHESGHASYLGS